jgi:hypothetical protein
MNKKGTMMGKDGPKYSLLVQVHKRYGIMIARKKHEGRNELGKEAPTYSGNEYTL